jgi:hypothetical protein
MRGITENERLNLSWLRANDINYGLIEVTETGLSKSILDATEGFRDFLKGVNAHDFSTQLQGPEAKVFINCSLWIDPFEHVESRLSAYRPNTKSGDPRIWISNLKYICKPGDIFIATWIDQTIVVWNLENVSLDSLQSNYSSSNLWKLLNRLSAPKSEVRAELTGLLNDLASRGWIKGIKTGSTSVGHLLETELGIQQNSSKNPDYKGIELKATGTMAKSANRYNLFAKVPTWSISELKSSRQIVDKYGYPRGQDFQLYCTVKFGAPNSNGLYLNYSQGFLEELHTNFNDSDVAKWDERILLHELESKHAETFWVKAKRQKRADGVYFQFESVVNTKNPLLEQFIPLVQAGEITLDHLIKKSPSGEVKEKGPLFKIRATSLGLLFPEPELIQLVKPKTTI